MHNQWLKDIRSWEKPILDNKYVKNVLKLDYLKIEILKIILSICLNLLLSANIMTSDLSYNFLLDIFITFDYIVVTKILYSDIIKHILGFKTN